MHAKAIQTIISSRRQKIIYALVVLALFGLAAALILINLENQVIMAYDEARHGANAYEMVRSGDYIVHTYQGEPDIWNLKPPLSFWLIALNYKLFGFNCVAFRLHSAVAALFTMLSITLWTKKRHGLLASGLVLLFLVVNPAVYGLNFARTGDADSLHILFTTIAMLCMLDSERDIRWLYGSALCFGFSFLAKSYHAGIIPLVCFAYVCATGRLKELKWKNFLLLVVLGLAPILPWAVARYLRDGTDFFIQMLQTDVGDRVTGMGAPWYFFFQKWADNPVIVVFAAICIIRLITKAAGKAKLSGQQKGLLLWVCLPVFIYSLSSFKLYHYSIPSIVGVGVAAGLSTASFLKKSLPRVGRVILFALLAAAVIFQFTVNFQTVLGKDDKGSFQRCIDEMLDRELDGGKHAYFQSVDYGDRWMQNDLLRALLSGDVVCLDGGIEAFEQDEEPALLIIQPECMPNELWESYQIYYESSTLCAFEN